MSEQLPALELVGGGLAEWPDGRGPRGETIAPAAFLDASGYDGVLDLPHRFREAGIEAWHCAGEWEAEPLGLVVRVRAPVEAAFRIPLDRLRHGALIDSLLREGGCYICPTTPRLGINARLARDQSFYCTVDPGFAPTWRALRSGRR